MGFLWGVHDTGERIAQVWDGNLATTHHPAVHYFEQSFIHGENFRWSFSFLKKKTKPRPLLSNPFHSLRSLLLILVLLYTLLGRVPLNALRNRLVVFGDVVQEPVQAVLDGLVDLLTVAQDCRARFLTTQTAILSFFFFKQINAI